jgi:hypothetical protein
MLLSLITFLPSVLNFVILLILFQNEEARLPLSRYVMLTVLNMM